MQNVFRFLFTLSLVFAVGCASLLNLKEPRIEEKQIQVDSANLKSLKMSLVLGIQNPNAMEFPLKDLKAELSVDGQPFIQRTWNDLPVLRKNGKTTVKLPLEVDWSQMFEAGLKFATFQKLPYRLKGSVEIKGFTLPFDESGEISLNEKK